MSIIIVYVKMYIMLLPHYRLLASNSHSLYKLMLIYEGMYSNTYRK
jgi:hypothetical protein